MCVFKFHFSLSNSQSLTTMQCLCSVTGYTQFPIDNNTDKTELLAAGTGIYTHLPCCHYDNKNITHTDLIIVLTV